MTATEHASQHPPGMVLRMENWVVYNNPTDYPGKWVLRRWEIQQGNPEPAPTTEVYVAEMYSEIISHLPGGLIRLARSAADVRAIVEVWI